MLGCIVHRCAVRLPLMRSAMDMASGHERAAGCLRITQQRLDDCCEKLTFFALPLTAAASLTSLFLPLTLLVAEAPGRTSLHRLYRSLFLPGDESR